MTVGNNRFKVLAVMMALLLVWGMSNLPAKVGMALAEQDAGSDTEATVAAAQADEISASFDCPHAYAQVDGQQVDLGVDVKVPTSRDFKFQIACDTGYVLDVVQVMSRGTAQPIPFEVVDGQYVIEVAYLAEGNDVLISATTTQLSDEGQEGETFEAEPFGETSAVEPEGTSAEETAEELLVPLAVHEDMNGITVGDLRYDVKSDGTAIARGLASGGSSYHDLAIPDDVEYNGATYRVTSIGYNAFSELNLSGTLTIGSNVETIEQYAFLNSSGFEGDLIIPDSVITIGTSAFSSHKADSDGLGGLILGQNVTTIGDTAFSGRGFTGQLVLPDSVTTVGYASFYACQKFTGTIKLSENLSSVGSYAFSYLHGVSGVLTIPSSLTYINDYAFYFNQNLTRLELPSSVTYIGDQAFAFCYVLSGTVVKTSSMTIETFAFYRTLVTVIDDPDALVEVDSIVYYVDGAGEATALYHKDRELAVGALELSQGFTHEGVDYEVVAIETGAFARSPGLVGPLVLPSSLKTIGANAFYECTGFTEVAIPESVETIGNNAFYETTGIQNMTHKKLANLSLSLPAIGSKTLDDLSYTGYEERGVVDSSDEETGVKLGKAAKWLNAERTEAEIRIDYGKPVPSNAKLDVIFVLDYSNSMLYSDDSTKTTVDGVDYQYPRSLIMDDLVSDAVSQLTAANAKGYDIRVGLTAFGYQTRWNSGGVGDAGFSKNASELLGCIEPLTTATSTNYSAGLADATAMLDARQDTSRQAIVVFLSDGAPYPAENDGVAEAAQLRANNINVYPLGIYQGSDAALQAISFDQSTIYSAHDTQSFESDLGTLLHNAFTKMNDVLKDVVSEWFEVESVGDISVSAGTASLAGDTVSWDLANEDCGKLYSLTMKVKVKAPYYNDEYKPTNASLVTNEIIPTAQPELYRGVLYKVTYEANGGTGSVPVDAKSPYPKSSTVTVLGKGSLSKSPQIFAGWKIKDDPSGTVYQEGDTFVITQDTTLVAQWEDDYIIITAQDFRMHISEAQAHQAKSPSEQLRELIQRGIAKAHWASTGAPVDVDYAVVETPDGQGRNIPAAVGVYDVTYYAGSGKYEVYTTIKATVYGDPFTVVYQPGSHGTFATQTYGNLDYGVSTPAFVGTPSGEAGWHFAGWAPELNAVVTGDAVYVAQWTEGTPPIIPLITPPTTPDPTPTPTPTTPNPGVPSEVTRIVERAETTFEQVDSISELVIENAETPLAQNHRDCWVHWYILLGIVVTAIYGIGVLVRRQRFVQKIDSYVDRAIDEANSDKQQPGWTPTYQSQEA